MASTSSSEALRCFASSAAKEERLVNVLMREHRGRLRTKSQQRPPLKEWRDNGAWTDASPREHECGHGHVSSHSSATVPQAAHGSPNGHPMKTPFPTRALVNKASRGDGCSWELPQEPEHVFRGMSHASLAAELDGRQRAVAAAAVDATRERGEHQNTPPKAAQPGGANS